MVVNRGYLQGGVLSPLLWNMEVGSLLRRFHNAHCRAQADNMVLLQKGKFISRLCVRMHGALNCVENWCKVIGLSLNADKTTMVLLTNNRNIGGFYNPRLFGTELRMTDQDE
jgi:hypothetical protein